MLIWIISIVLIISGCKALDIGNSPVSSPSNTTPTVNSTNPTEKASISPIPMDSPTVTPSKTQDNKSGSDKRGNTVGNIISGWDCAVQNDILYSVLFDFDSFNYALYSSHIDGSDELKIYSGEIHILNIIGNWIYYSDSANDNTLCKMKTDGSSITKITDDEAMYINVIGDWIYYSVYPQAGLYKIKLDGTGKTKLLSYQCAYVIAVNDWIYFSNSNDNDKLYKIRTDGSQLTKMNDDDSNYPNIFKDWIYYSTESGLYKMKTDGSEKIKLNDDDLRYINVDGDWVYYINFTQNSGLYKMRLDGSDITKLDEGRKGERLKSISIIGDWIRYIKDIGDDYEVYQIKKDGTDKKMIRPGIYSQ